MMTELTTKLIQQEKLIAILRGIPRDKVVFTVKALRDGGIRLVEVTFAQNSPTCLEDTAHAISDLTQSVSGVSVGAGTVLSVEQVDAAHDAGAAYIISPNTDRAVIERTNALGMLSIPGAFTPSEIVAARQYGAAFVKLFPAGNLGASYIKAIRAPISHIPLLAVGGIDLNNMADFYRAGICGFGIGANITKKDLIESGDYPALTALAREYVLRAAQLGKER